jgi:hypothetical protein
MTMLCPMASARMTCAPASALPLWRWLLGGLVPLFAILLTHSGVVAGSRTNILLWDNWIFAMEVPGLAILFSHLANQYFIQGVGGLSAGCFLRLLLVAGPTLAISLFGISLVAPILVALGGLFVLPVLSLVRVLPAALSQPVMTGLIATPFAATYLACGYLAGGLLPSVEPRGIAGSLVDGGNMRTAHCRGGAVAALLLMTGRGGIALVPAGWAYISSVRALLDEPVVAVGLVMTIAWLPHLLLTWRAIAAATPQVAVLPPADFVLRLVTVVFVIVALAAIEGVLLGVRT